MPPPHPPSPVLSPATVRYSCYRRESSSDYSDYTEEEFSSDEEEQEDPKDYRPGGWGREGWGEVGGVGRGWRGSKPGRSGKGWLLQAAVSQCVPMQHTQQTTCVLHLLCVSLGTFHRRDHKCTLDTCLFCKLAILG